VDKSVNRSAAYVCAFSASLCKNAKCDGYALFVAETVTIGKHSPKSDLKKKCLPTPTTLDQTPSDYSGLLVVAVLVQKMLEKHAHLLQGH